MRRFLAVVWIAVAWLVLAVGSQAVADSSYSVPNWVDTKLYVGTLMAKAPPQPNPQVSDAALKQARAALARKDGAAAVPKFEQAIINGAASPSVWLELSAAWMALPTPNKDRALQSAVQAGMNDPKDDERVATLLRVASLMDEAFGKPDEAAKALGAIRAMGDKLEPGTLDALAPKLEERWIALRRKAGLTLRDVTVNSDDAVARVCFQFNDRLSTRKGLRFDDYVRVEPPTKLSVDARDNTLCLRGVNHGSSYTVTLRQGLPGEDGVEQKADETQRVRVPDRAPLVAFKGSAFILPRSGPDGVPVMSVNADKLLITVYRVPDRGLVASRMDGQLFRDVSGRTAETISDLYGERLWTGTLEVKGERNRQTLSALPFRQAVGDQPRPGLYAITAKPADVEPGNEWNDIATQWVLVSDIGLTSLRGADGLTVFARSYATAKPLAGVEIALVANNNAEIARATTDELGRVRFAPGLLKTGGNTPNMVMAYHGTDYAMQDLLNAAFDLSDRGVGGRAAPGPMDAFVYTDRGVYRQGETVNLSILLRDDKTDAVENFPLTVKILRPSGTEYFSGPLTAQAAGGYSLPLSLSRTAPLGGWQVEIYSDPKGAPIGSGGFQVEDFVPVKLALDLTPGGTFLVPGKPFEVVANGRFLYGPPAAGLGGTAEVAIQPDPTPYPTHKDYRFGRVQDSVDSKLDTLEFPTTDAQGQSRVAVTVPSLPDTSRPLRAEIRVSLSEPGGRPVHKAVTVPIRAKSHAIGLRPHFSDGRIGEGQEAGFDLVTLAPDGTPIATPGLSWELLEERVSYQWFRQHGRYSYNAVTRSVAISSGTIAALADKPVTLALGRRDFGRYRIEVTDKAAGVATSYRFSAGWQSEDSSGNTPDKLEIATDKPAYSPGDTARVRITPPFAGEVLLTVATDRLFEARNLTVPADGLTVEVPVNAAWGPGAYVTATVFRPPVVGKERQPVRAVGVAWVGIDPAVRTLDVALDAPSVIRPRSRLDVGVTVKPTRAGGAAEDVYVTLAAVDEGILRLTDFASPQPAKHFYGKRRLGLDIRDDYGRLIDAMDGSFGALRQGGDSGGIGLPVVPFTVVSLFQGPVKLGPDGTARIGFDVPDFNGELRLMAVAYSRSRVGSAAGPVTVRDPLVADAILPRFLAPGDESRVTLSLHNVEAAAGTYAVTVTARDAVAVEGGALSVPLAKGERKTLVLPLKGVGAGVGKVTLSVAGAGSGADALALSHDYAITVRPARAVDTQFITRQVPPGETMRFSAADLAAYVPGTTGWSVSFSNAPPFDIGGILRALDRYPLGCLEQTVSRALPLLAVRDVELALGTDRKPDDSLDGRVQQAVSRTLDKQRYDGAFGLWSAQSEADGWLTAYATEFLIRAKQKGNPVPDKPLNDALGWLRQRAIASASEPEAMAVRAYALHTLALAGVSLPGPARYLHDTAIDKLPTPLAKGQLGAALARMGDGERAASAFDSAVGHLARNEWAADYGSTLRDAAALIVLASEVGMTGKRLPALLDRLPASELAANRTNTQEQAWAVLAADALLRGAPAGVTVTLPGGERRNGSRVDLRPTLAQLSAGLPVVNSGSAPLWQAVSVSGVPTAPQPAAREGLRIKRNFFTRKGEPLNLDTIRQNDVFVVVLEGEANTKLFHQTAVTHPLPAGWEIENAKLGAGGTADLPWLDQLTVPNSAESRDDRFVAALDLTEDQARFKLAFIVRAITPGVYELPGASVEDMYKPRFFARQAVGRITVHPAE
ncbi:alpha-2-macroglobulin family protein [Azospirillum griseum]|uniref:Alpha-2-macroglobulin family protein n=1 Tax=Azospirillum griseum TaxID=2496639 RepID=A0A431VHK0_9PROT|nr:alpha-2-macroglobulin [Azospirillum griseum]RTR20618.1 alpha-2-macroglobulin family protein [Azospirillum griseum]